MTAIDVPDPPDLPAVPEVDPCPAWDEHNPACRSDPRYLCSHGADCRCPTPPDVEIRACWAVMPCPTPPDRRVRACGFHDAHLAASTVIARIIETRVGDGVVVVIGAGSDQGISRTARASVMRGDTDEVLGAATIIRVDTHATIARVTLTVEQLQGARVRFDP